MELKENERIDDLHRNNYVIIQNKKTFCFGIDAVLLSSFAKAKKGDIVLDIGTGTGIIPILMSAKTDALKFFAIDIQKDSVEMAKRSVALNNLTEKIEIKHLDIKDALNEFPKNYFDVIVSNPPYKDKGAGILNNFTPKTIARHEIMCDLNDILYNSYKLLKNNGRLYLIHRPNRLIDIIYGLRKFNLEPKQIRFIQPYLEKEPNLVLIEAIKGAKPFLKILPNLIIYDENQKYTKEVFDIYYN